MCWDVQGIAGSAMFGQVKWGLDVQCSAGMVQFHVAMLGTTLVGSAGEARCCLVE